MKPRKWAAEIKAWADGKPIQHREIGYKVWIDEYSSSPAFGSESLEFRVKPQEPEWICKNGDLILAWDVDEAVARPVIFRAYGENNSYPWICKCSNYVNAKPHPLQQERDKYRATIKRLTHAPRNIHDLNAAIESIITMQEEAKEALK